MARAPASAPAASGSVVDETLLDELARMTPEERLRQNDLMATTILELRHAHAAASGHADDAPRAPGRDRG